MWCPSNSARAEPPRCHRIKQRPTLLHTASTSGPLRGLINRLRFERAGFEITGREGSKEAHMIRTMKALAAAALLLAAAGPDLASAQKAGDLSIEHAWSRATPRGAKVGAGHR